MRVEDDHGRRPAAVASQTGMPPRLNRAFAGLAKKIAFPHPKAAVNAPHSRRSARFGDARQSRSVWSARVFSTAFRMRVEDNHGRRPAAPESRICGTGEKNRFPPSESGGERAALQTLRAVR